MLASAVLPSCALFVDFDSFSAGSRSSDVGRMNDGGAGNDADPEATVDATAPNDDSLCDDAAFCDNFERTPLNIQGPWDGIWGDSPAAISIHSTGGNRTDGGFLRVEVPGGRVASAGLFRMMPPATKMRFAFAVRVRDMIDREIDIGSIQFNPTETTVTEVYLSVDVAQGALRVKAGEHSAGEVKSNRTFAAMPLTEPGRWSSVVVLVDPTASPPRVSIALNGIAMVSNQEIGVGVGSGPPFITAGCSYAAANDGGASVFDIDDVRIDVLP